jgi:hypothetical protein
MEFLGKRASSYKEEALCFLRVLYVNGGAGVLARARLKKPNYTHR